MSLNVPGLSPRALALFGQAKAASPFRWGKRARAVAGACLAIALRESNRPDALHDIAAVVDLPYSSLTREFLAITSTLHLPLSIVDPSVHVIPLQDHLALVLAESQSILPSSLSNTIRAIPLLAASQTASALSRLLPRLSPQHDILRLPTGPTACAFYILALEAEQRALINPLAALAQCLGSRCSVSKGSVMARYKIVQDEIACWVKQVPWLDKYENRPKVGKRLIVARGLKDVIEFQDQLWQKKPKLELELQEIEEEPPRKRAKLNKTMSDATRFLHDPIGSSISSLNNRTASNALSMAVYLLSTPSLAQQRPPTRLQLLSIDRGGEARLSDADLFVPGELESLLRTDEEIAVLREHFGWTRDEDMQGEEDFEQCARKSNIGPARADIVSSSRKRTSKPERSCRIDADALARLLAQIDQEDDPCDTEFHVDTALLGLRGMEFVAEARSDGEEPFGISLSQQFPTSASHNDEVILTGWRPPSPSFGGAYETHYEEEYD